MTRAKAEHLCVHVYIQHQQNRDWALRIQPPPFICNYVFRQYFIKCVYVLCSGDMYEVGAESGRYYCLNVPLRDGIDDQSEFFSTHTMAANDLKVDVNNIVVFRLPPALPASDQTGSGLLPAHMHRTAGQ